METRVLVRSRKDPFKVATADEVFRRNLIGNNAGNLVFSQAMHRAVSVPWATVDSNGFSVDPDRAGAINEKYDMFVVPLANAFRLTAHEHIDKLATLIERLRIPVVLAGVGVQLKIDDPTSDRLDRINATIKRLVAAILDRSATVGVRGEVTRDYLKGLGFGDGVVDVIGCPSMFMSGADLAMRQPANPLHHDARVSVNVSPYVARMGRIVTTNMSRYPKLCYTAQDLKTLGMMLNRVDPPDSSSFAADIPYHVDHPLFQDNRMRFCIDPKIWFQHLASYDFSFGTRIHGTIASLLAGTPAVLLAHDSRTLELAEYHELPFRIIDDVAPDVDPAQLLAEADFDALNRNHPERFDRFVAFLDKNGVEHVFAPGSHASRGAHDFDAKIAATEYPAPLDTSRSAFRRRQVADRSKRIKNRLRRGMRRVST